jgi:hypothetical protein
MTKQSDKEILPAGSYYIGDLCYVIPDAWSEVGKLIFDDWKSQRAKSGIFTLEDGRKFAIFSTAYGDGEYYDNFGSSYCVDSGSIGCILTKDIPNWDQIMYDSNVLEVRFLGQQILPVVFDIPFEVKSENVMIHFGDITIDTTGEVYYGELDTEIEYDSE